MSTTVSIRVDERQYRQMRIHDELNWSAVLRDAIDERLEALERIEEDRATTAADAMDEMREATERNAAEVVHEWRKKRK